ncbi:MAG: dihydroorotate dehydrogenase [Candidatus Heimdallarchaeota archaeon]|nr:dihydroorotate dehydrogenase [Candidatus Heimdallarchaeota archaeon]MCG3256456.1 dihydroorotate dehydrogenase [Candidatus Heimdallarchaeota archaeon]MCK4611521.1 dihydroorotate dehydrogenase [Candidatus Heimdallarchaeota archaeon]
MSLATKIGNITIRNPIILASGVLGTTYSTLNRMYEAGLGAVITKSISSKSRAGNPNPSVFALNDIRSVISSVGLANPGYQIFREDIEILMKNSTPTIVSIFGENKEEFIEVLDGLKDLPVLAFELNISYLNTEKGGTQIGTDPDLVYEIVKELREKTRIPLWVKLTPNVSDIIEIASAAVQGGCDALVAINTLKAMVIDIHTKQPILGYKKGGLSGAAIKPVGIRYVYDLYEHFGNKIPLLGVGGIFRGEDIIEYLLAGASAVEIGTSLGVAYPENMVRFFQMKIKKYMKEQQFDSIGEITGGAHR